MKVFFAENVIFVWAEQETFTCGSFCLSQSLTCTGAIIDLQYSDTNTTGNPELAIEVCDVVEANHTSCDVTIPESNSVVCHCEGKMFIIIF